MKITRVEPFILHVPVTGQGIADSTHQVTHWGVVGAIVATDSGLRGYGYTGTLAHLPSDRAIKSLIGEAYGPLLIGEDPQCVRALWQKLFHAPGIRWVGRAGIAQMALAAVDVALWDLKAKDAGLPLWKLLGGAQTKRLAAYNTDGGWLNWSREQLVECARAMVAEGFAGLKIKIGSPDPHDDLDRLAAVREAVGPRILVMVDANGRWDLPTAVRFGRRFVEHDVYWFEEPLWCDDVAGHARLARAIRTPIALGEQLYSIDAFRAFIDAGAVDYIQPDATRLGGITPWWEVADLAFGHRLPVVPHAGDMVQIHLQTALAHPACEMAEYIPWLRTCFEEPATVEAGHFKLPHAPGAGTTLTADAIQRYGVP